jgi:alkylation response protein AidB-like acyl-CoA dehydrogenase
MMETIHPKGDLLRQVLVRRANNVAETLMAQAPMDEAHGTLTPETIAALEKAGSFRLKLPAVLGGDEADPVTQILVFEALSKANASAGWCAMVGATSAALPGAFLADAAIEIMFGGGRIPKCAVAAMPLGKTKIVDGGYRVTGRWPFASGVRHSEWLSAGAIVVRDDRPEHRMMVFPTASACIHDNWQVAGLKGTGSCDFSVEGLFVADAFSWALLSDPPKRGGPLYRIPNPGFVANEHAGFALGVARRALDAFLAKEVARSRSYGPAASSMSARPSIQRALGASELKLRSARNLALDVNDEAWRTVCANQQLSIRQLCELRAAATYCTEVALDIVTEVFRYSGGGAIYERNILQQCLRDMNAAAQHLMVSEISYENLGRTLLGVPDVNPMG